MCLGVWQRISQPPILQLNAEHPPGDGFGSLQNGKSIFAEGVIGGLGGEKFCVGREGCASVTSRGAKFCIFFHYVFVYAVYWENMNGSIFIRGAVQGKSWGGGGVFWWVHVGCEDRLETCFHEIVYSFTEHSKEYTVHCSFLLFPHIHSFFSPLNSANGASHEEQELQFDLPPAEGVNPAGLHPAGVWKDCKGAGHEYDLCWLHRRDSLYKRYYTITPKFYISSISYM